MKSQNRLIEALCTAWCIASSACHIRSQISTNHINSAEGGLPQSRLPAYWLAQILTHQPILAASLLVLASRPSGFQWPRLPSWKPPDEEDKPHSAPITASGHTPSPHCLCPYSLTHLHPTAFCSAYLCFTAPNSNVCTCCMCIAHVVSTAILTAMQHMSIRHKTAMFEIGHTAVSYMNAQCLAIMDCCNGTCQHSASIQTLMHAVSGILISALRQPATRRTFSGAHCQASALHQSSPAQ